MLKNLTILFVFVFFISCGGKSDHSSSSDSSQAAQTAKKEIPTLEPKEEVTEVTESSSVPNEALTFDANIKMIGFNPDQEDKIFAAVELIKQVVASQEFKDRILNHTYNGKKTFVDNNGLSNQEIYEKILAGAEKLMPAKNNAIDVELELYSEETTTIGYTFGSTVRIWMNTKYFNTYTSVQVSDNLFHEWIHKIGFGHDVEYSPSRRYSVPYAIGYLVEELAKKYD